jgi:DNA primase
VLVRAAMPVVDFVLSRLNTRYDLKTAQGKAAAAAEIADVLAGIADPIEQDHYTNEVAARLSVEPAAVRRLLNTRRQARPPVVEAAPAAPPPTIDVRGDIDDEYLLALLIRLREVQGAPSLEGTITFVLPQSREVYRSLATGVPQELEAYAQRARQRLPDVERLPTDKLLEEIELKRLGIRERLLEGQRRQLSTLLSEGGLDREEAARLLDQYRQEMGEVARQLPPERESAGSSR